MRNLNELDSDKIASKYHSIGAGKNRRFNKDIEGILKDYVSKISIFRSDYPKGYPLYYDEIWRTIASEMPHDFYDFFNDESKFTGFESDFDGLFYGDESINDIIPRIKDKIEFDILLRDLVYSYIDNNFISTYNFEQIDGQTCIRIYRMVSVDESTDIAKEYGGAGVYWSTLKKNAQIIADKGGLYDITIHALCPIKNIDWIQSFTRNLRFGEDETEVNPYKGSLIYISQLDIEDTKTKEKETKTFDRLIKAKA